MCANQHPSFFTREQPRPPSEHPWARLVAIVCLIALACVLLGCGGRGTIQAERIRGLVHDVADTHDAYVRNDPDLDELEREVLLTNTIVLRDVVAAAATEVER